MKKPGLNRIGWVAGLLVVLLAGLGWMMRERLGSMVAGMAGRGSPAASTLPDLPSRATGTGTARLRWNPVEAAASGSDTDPVIGFRVYLGTSPDDLRLEASIADPAATSYVVQRLPKGTYYYTVTTYTKLGIESPKPAAVSKTIE